MINTVKNSKLNFKTITLVNAPVIGATKIDVVFASYENIFVGKHLRMFVVGGFIIGGIIGRNKNTWFITLDEPLVGGEYDTDNYNATYYETFSTDKKEDNAHVTFSDIISNLVSKESVFENGEVVNYGEEGLVTGHDKYLLNNEIEQQIKLSSRPTLNNVATVNTLLCNVDVKKNRLFKHTIVISGVDLYVRVSLLVNNLGLNIPLEYTFNVDEFSTSEELKDVAIDFKLENNMDSNGIQNYVSISAMFDNSKLVDAPTSLDYQVLHITNKNTIFYDVPPVLTNKNPLRYNLELLYQNVYSDVFKVNANVDRFTYNGIVLKRIKKIEIDEFTDLSTLRTEGDYYMHNGDFSSLVGRPTTNNTRFDLQVINMNLGSTANVYYIMQVYTSYEPIQNSSEYKIGSWSRISYPDTNGDLKFSAWFANAVGGHTHPASDITESDTQQFVTKIQKENWDKMYTEYSSDEYSWKLSVGTIAELTTKYPTAKQGWCCVVKETNSIFVFDGEFWQDTQAIVSEERSGNVSIEQFEEYFIGSSQSKFLKEKTDSINYINRHTINPKTIYGDNYQYIFRNNIDLINRTVPLTEPLGDYSYQQGFNVLMSGNDNYGIGRDIQSINFDNAFGIGLGLRFSRTYQTIFGTFNKVDNTDVLQIGSGTSDTDRNNIFAVNREGVAKLDGGYSVKDKTSDDLLVADGTTINKALLLGYKVGFTWDATIIPLPAQRFEVLDDEGNSINLDKHSLIFVNGILLQPEQYEIDEDEPYFFTILETLDNNDKITVK